MNEADLLTDAFTRVSEVVHETLDDLPSEALIYRIDPDANTIGWLIWHLSRVQDDHIAGVADSPQIWTSQGWADRFGLPFDSSEIGYGQSPEDVGRVQVSKDLLLEYFDAVHTRTLEYLQTMTSDGLDVIVDKNWDPPVTLGVRLVSVISDDLQHAGQAAFVAGIFARTQA